MEENINEEYVGNMTKYMENMKEYGGTKVYMGNMLKCFELCGKFEEYQWRMRAHSWEERRGCLQRQLAKQVGSPSAPLFCTFTI